jgi:hypothetical protein
MAETNEIAHAGESLSRQELFALHKHYQSVVNDQLGFCYQYLKWSRRAVALSEMRDDPGMAQASSATTIHDEAACQGKPEYSSGAACLRHAHTYPSSSRSCNSPEWSRNCLTKSILCITIVAKRCIICENLRACYRTWTRRAYRAPPGEHCRG